MSKKEVVDSVRGKYSRYDVEREPGGVFSGPKFRVVRDDDKHITTRTSLDEAFEAAQEAAKKNK